MASRDRRARVLRLAAGAVLFVATFSATLAAARCAMADTAPRVDYVAEFNRITLGVQPEGENAWPLYVEAHELFIEAASRHPRSVGYRIDDLLDGAWDDPRHQAARLMLSDLADSLGVLERASNAPGFACLYEAEGSPPFLTRRVPVQGSLAPFVVVGRLGSVNAAAMRGAAERGDWAAATDHLRIGLIAARHLTHQPEYADWIRSNWLGAIMLREVRQLAVERLPDAETCRNLAAVIRERPLRALPYSHLLHFERLAALEAIQRLYSDNGRGGGVFVSGAAEELPTGAPRTLSARIVSIASMLFPGRGAVTRDVLGSAAQTASWFDLPRSDRLAVPIPVMQLPSPLSGLENIYFSFAAETAAFLAQSRNGMELLETERAGTFLLLRIFAHRAEHGRFPAALDGLGVPPEETIDPVTGLPFVYEPAPASRDGAGAPPFRLLAPPDFDGRITDLAAPRREISP